jgi:putative sporulation protein YtxC
LKLFSVGLTEKVEMIQVKLQDDCKILKSQGFLIAIDLVPKGVYTFLECNVIEGEMSFRNYEKIKSIVKTYVANHLCNYIVKYGEENFIYHSIMKRYQYFNNEETKAVFHNTVQLLAENSTCEEYHRLQNDILSKLLYYLEANQEIVIDGFVKFRLRDYQEYLINIIDQAVDTYMVELEYQEFISVLRYFVRINTEQALTIQVMMKNSGPYLLLDESGELLRYQYIDFVDRHTEDDYAELLISTLINIAPQKIILHNIHGEANAVLIKTLKNIFQERICVLDDNKLGNIVSHLDSDLL